jgi:hypothetical protein
VRTFKLYDLEDSCENYKLFVTYNGKAKGCEQFFDLDETHRLFTDEELEVCGNTYSFLMNTRFGKYFKGRGNKSRHYGIYDYCGYCSGGKGGAFKKPLEPFKKSKKKVKDIEFPELKLKDCKLCTEGDCSSCKS